MPTHQVAAVRALEPRASALRLMNQPVRASVRLAPRRVFLSALLLLAIAFTAKAQTPVAVEEPPKPLAPGRVEVAVNDLHCASCVKKVARKLYAVKGVKKVTASLKDDLVVVILPKDQATPVADLWTAVEAGGVKPTELRYLDQRLDAEAVAPLLAEVPEAQVR